MENEYHIFASLDKAAQEELEMIRQQIAEAAKTVPEPTVPEATQLER